MVSLQNINETSSVPDPNPDPPDPHVFGPPGLVRGMDPDPDPSIVKQK